MAPALIWFSALALAVAGPLLGGGYLLLLDYPSGPEAPNFSWFPVPSSGDVGNAAPLYAVETVVRAVWAPLTDKLLLLAPIVIGGLGVYRLVRTKLAASELAAVYGGTLYVVNPFVYDRLVVGHLYFVLSYALLPWAVSPLFDAIRDPSLRRAVVIGTWSGVLALVSVHLLGIYAVLVLATAVAAQGRAAARLAFAAAWASVLALLTAYWTLPAMLAPPGRDVGGADLAEYETRPDGFVVIPTLLSMYGFWRDEFPREVEDLPALYVLLIPILGLAALGLIALIRGANRRVGISLAVAGLVALLLAAGTAFPPTGRAFRWLATSVPFAGVYREPQKFLAIVVLVLAVAGAVGLSTLRRRQAVLGVIATGAVLLYGSPMLWGLSGRVELVEYPKSWAEADQIMADEGEGRLLILPWALYARWTFSEGRIIANPARSFFSGREVLSGDDVNLETIPTQSTDPFSYYIDDLFSRDPADVDSAGHLLAPLGVRFVVWTADADIGEYRMLLRAPDVDLIREWDDLTLFENRAWRGERLALANGTFVPRASALFGTARERAAAEQLVRSPPLVERADDDFLPIAKASRVWPDVEPAPTAYVSTGKRCTDGWRLGDQRAACHLGAVAAFRSPESEAVLWRPAEGARIVGYAIAIVTLASLLSAALFERRRARASRTRSIPPNSRP